MSLRPKDLEGLVQTQLSIDEYKSKLAEDRDVVVLGIAVKEESAAHDLGDFIERGPFDLWDVDISPAPNEEGFYYVFVEIERSHLMWNTIHSIIDHTDRITGLKIDALTFTCPDNDRPQPLTEDNFKSCVLQSPYRWDIAHGIYPEVPKEQPADESVAGRMRFLKNY
jgi:hypothetical protein